MIPAELSRCVEFINEIEKLKIVYRQNSVTDKSRSENSAEHSWYVALMAMVLSGFANTADLDMLKVLKMILIHDIVEIDAGDTFLYDEESAKAKQTKEIDAAKRIFGLLPERIAKELHGIWSEFEERVSPESIFAASLDSLQPLINHLHTENPDYKYHNVKTEKVMEKKRHIADGSLVLWEYAKQVIKRSEEIGLYMK